MVAHNSQQEVVDKQVKIMPIEVDIKRRMEKARSSARLLYNAPGL